MRLEVRHSAPPGSPGPAFVQEYARHALFFALSRHDARADGLLVDLRVEDCAGEALYHCVVSGSVDRLGAFRVGAQGGSVHAAVEQAVHRLELRLVESALGPRPPQRSSRLAA